MSGKINLIDVATTSFDKEYDEPVSLNTLLEDAGLDLPESSDVTVRVNNVKVDDMEMMVSPGDLVLITRNIAGGA